MNTGASVAAVLDPPEHWKSALERVAKLGDDASAMKGLQSIGLSVEAGSAQTVDVYIEVANPRAGRPRRRPHQGLGRIATGLRGTAMDGGAAVGTGASSWQHHRGDARPV